MPDSFIPYGRQTISEADIQAVVDVLRSPLITQGPVVPAFEQAVAKKVGAKHGIAVNSATSALHIACLALGLGPGDRLWTSPITFGIRHDVTLCVCQHVHDNAFVGRLLYNECCKELDRRPRYVGGVV